MSPRDVASIEPPSRSARRFPLRRSAFVTGAALLLLASCAAPEIAAPSPAWSGQHEVLLRYGGRNVDGDFAPLDSGGFGGLEYSWGRRESPWRFNLGVLRSNDDAGIDQTFTFGDGSQFQGPVEFDNRVTEIFGGVRYERAYVNGRVRPHIGVGVSWIRGSIESSPPLPVIDSMNSNNSIFPPDRIDDSDQGFGGFAQIGVQFPLTDGLLFGVDYRFLIGPDLDLFGVSRNSDYQLIGATLGWRF